MLEARAGAGLGPPELAFYGGTFTAMPGEERQACLDLVVRARRAGRITSFRCSTRPDSVDDEALAALAAAGCSTVELGVQSFADAALRACGRGYDGAAALAACQRVKAAGLALGVQLLPGLPGAGPGDFIADVEIALSRAGADMLRFYPCLVLRGTGLEAAWRAGAYAPLPLEDCLDLLARGWLLAGEAGVPVIRMGLAPEKGLEAAIVAGPVHAALGSRVMARALLLRVRGAAAGRPLAALEAPLACKGYFWGHKGELRPAWRHMGVTPATARFVEDTRLRLFFS
jgi:histone acetyltransferase (RNA polymerase elongator complex component)